MKTILNITSILLCLTSSTFLQAQGIWDDKTYQHEATWWSFTIKAVLGSILIFFIIRGLIRRYKMMKRKIQEEEV